MQDAATEQHVSHIISDRAPTSIELRFAEDDDGTWFRLINSLITSGLWATLRNETRAVLPVLSHLGRENGTALIDNNSILLSLAGVSESGWDRARREMLQHQLIEQVRPGCYRLFPGRPVWNRTPRTVTGGAPSVTGGARLSQSTVTGDGPSVTRGAPCIKTERVERKQNSSSARRECAPAESTIPTPPGREPEEFAAVVALLRKEGLKQADIEELAPAVGLLELRARIKTADAVERNAAAKGQRPWKASRAAFVIASIKDRYSLYASVEDEMLRDHGEELWTRLAGLINPLLDEDECHLVQDAYRDPEYTLRKGGVRVGELLALGPNPTRSQRRGLIDQLKARAKVALAARRGYGRGMAHGKQRSAGGAM